MIEAIILLTLAPVKSEFSCIRYNTLIRSLSSSAEEARCVQVIWPQMKLLGTLTPIGRRFVGRKQHESSFIRVVRHTMTGEEAHP
jgi:hypothetical protein